MITQIGIKNFKALRDVTLKLTPIHVLIGPNDSGKTSILQAADGLCRSVEHNLAQVFQGDWEGEDLVWGRDHRSLVTLSVRLTEEGNELGYSLTVEFPAEHKNVRVREEAITAVGKVAVPLKGSSPDYTYLRGFDAASMAEKAPLTPPLRMIKAALSGVHYYALNPRLLGLPAAPREKRQFRFDRNGFGLAMCLDDIISYDWRRFQQLEERFCGLFPDVSSIKLVREKAYPAAPPATEDAPEAKRAGGKGIHFELKGSGSLVPAGQASDGMVLVLAYLALQALPKRPRLVLLEEPENGIHPKRLQELLGILRELVESQTHTQVIITTHSPYALDHFSPEEVTLCHKAADGAVRLKRLSESAKVAQQVDVFTLGEIWTGAGDEAIIESAAPEGSRR